MNNKPNFLIIGAQKGGSTWLYDTMKNHTEVFLPKKVELLHFSKKNCNDLENIETYAKHFDGIDNSIKVIGEKTPSYLWAYSEDREYCKPDDSHNKHIPHDVAQQLGLDTKLISSLRHPVMRAISAFFHHVERSRIDPEKSLSDYYHRMGIVDMGFYAEHLNEWMKTFDKKNFLTLIMERDIISNPVSGIEKVCNFLNISSMELKNENKASNAGMKKKWYAGIISTNLDNSPIITGNEIEFLVNLYQDDMNNLRILLDDPLDEWKKIDEELLNFAKAYRELDFHDKINLLSKENSKFGLSTFHQVLLESGIDLSVTSSKTMSKLTILEAPVKISNANILHQSSIGAFSYLIDGFIYNTDIGRYCSIARNVNIGQGNHPIDWLSSNPFQYESNFRIRTGEMYPYKDVYQNFNIPKENRDLVLASIRKPKNTIGNDVWIGHGVIINSGVKIGDGAIIGSGSVVTKDIPPYAIVAGVPAKIIKYRFEESIISELLKIKWWQYAPWSLADINFNNIEVALEIIKKRKRSGELIAYHVNSINIENISDIVNKQLLKDT